MQESGKLLRLIREKRMFSVTHLIIRISEYMKNGFP